MHSFRFFPFSKISFFGHTEAVFLFPVSSCMVAVLIPLM